jgi:transposase InsO family protein
MDDASRLMSHSAFCLGETALDIEGVLKQAVLKRGVPKKLLIDNGAAYRSHSLQGICARLGIRLVYCRPYQPEDNTYRKRRRLATETSEPKHPCKTANTVELALQQQAALLEWLLENPGIGLLCSQAPSAKPPPCAISPPI